MATDNEALVVAYLRYKPTFGLAVAAFVLFVLVTSAVTVLICTTKRCRWMLIVTLSGACEAAGYLCRVIFIKNATYAAYVSMQVLIVITPTIFACADYELAGILLAKAHTGVKWLKPRHVAGIFFGGDLLSIAVQGAGAGIATSAKNGLSNAELGSNMLLAGLIIQLIFFVLFVFLAIYVPFARDYTPAQARALRPLLAVLFINMFLLVWRNLYRVIEFAEPGGYFSKLATAEAYLFAFDCLLMLLAHAAWIPLFPAFYLPHYEATLVNDGVPPPSAQQLSITANSGAQRNGATVMQQPHDLEKDSKQSTC